MLLQPIITITITYDDKEEKNQIHKHSWLLIIWTHNKSNYIQTLIEEIPYVKLSHHSPLREKL